MSNTEYTLLCLHYHHPFYNNYNGKCYCLLGTNYFGTSLGYLDALSFSTMNIESRCVAPILNNVPPSTIPGGLKRTHV